MAHVVEWDFDARDAQAARRARTELVEYVRRECRDADPSSAELVFGELIGNVVRHAPGPITVEVDWNATDPILHVIDRGPAYDAGTNLPDDIMSESGRGLFLISVLGEDFSVTALPGYGNHARVRLRIERLERIAPRTTAPSC